METTRKMYGYARVSSKDQNEIRQIISLQEIGIPEENIFVDKQSGKDFNRPKYKRLMRKLKENDVIYVKSIDRLGRNYEDIIEQWKLITKEKHADIVIMDMPLLDTRRGKDLMDTFLSDVVLALLSYVSETERMNIRQRQAEGIAAAKARGVHFGRPPMVLPEGFNEAYALYIGKELTVSEAAKRCGMKRSTFFKRAQKHSTELEFVQNN